MVTIGVIGQKVSIRAALIQTATYGHSANPILIAITFYVRTFPKTPFIPVEHDIMPAREWVMPARVLQRRDYFKTYKVLPPGMPDYLSVSIEQSEEGTGRCTAAIYGRRAYVIHYDLKPHSRD